MTKLTDALHIPDTQSARDDRRLPIQRVGIKDVRYPLRLQLGGAPFETTAVWDLDVALPAEQKGTHMSRFVGWLNDVAAGDALLDCMFRTCNGRLTAAEALGHREFVLTRLYESA